MAVNLPEVLDKTTMKPVRVLHPSETMADLSILSVSTADIKILISEGIALGDWVRVYYPNGKSGVFRAGNPAYDYDKDTMTVSMNHGCVTLADNIVTEGYEEDSSGEIEEVYFEGTIREVVNKLLGYQKTKHWKLGTVEPTDEVKIEIKYQDVLTLINDAMEQVDDSYIDYDQQSYPWTINIRKKPTTVTSEGRLSRNVRSAQVSYDDSELITKLYCNELDTPLTSANVSKYGLREGFYYVSSDDSDWVAKACAKYLKNRENPVVSVTIDGADFSQITGVAIDKVVLADLYRLAIPKYSAVVEEQITELTYEDLINRPNECSITLGSHKNDLSSVLAETSSTASSASTTASYVSAREKTHWDNFIGEVDGLNTKITQLKDLIKLEANDVENRLHSELTITASQIQSRLTSGWTGYMSMITQTADQIRMEVNNRFFGLSSSISQTASNVNIQVRDAKKDLQSQIDVNADNISLKVSKGKVATELTVEMGNVKVKNGNLIVDGMVTADAVKAAIAKIDHLQVYGTITAYTIKMKAGTTEKNVWSAIEDLKYDRTVGNTVYLKYTKFNGIEGEVSFSKAALLKGTWSGGTYTAGPNSDGSSTIVATQLHNNPYKLTYWPLLNTYTVEVGYMQGGVLKSTGGNLSFIAEDAYKAGQDSVQIPHPTYSGSWDGGTYVVKADGVSVQSTSLGSVEIPEEGSEDIRWIGTTKWLSVPVVIKDTLTRDTGYHPQLNIPAGKAYDAGWRGYHDSNKFGMQVAADASIKNVYRPGTTPSATAEVWFKLRVQAAWATAPGSAGITDTNTVTWNAQRKLTSGTTWDNMVSVASTITLLQRDNAVYARVGAQDVAKRVITQNISVSGWAFIAGYADASGLKKASEAKARFSVKTTVNGTDYSSVIATNSAFKLGKQTDPKYAVLYYGATAIAWLKQPDPVVDDWHIGDGYADKDDGLVKKSSAKARFALSATANGSSVSKVVSTGKKFSLGKLINDNDYASLLYGSTAIAWLKMPERETPAPPEPTVNGFFASTGYAPSSGLEPLNSSKIRLNVGVKVNGTQHSAIVTTGSAFSLGNNFRTGYVTLYYGSTAVAWLKLPS